MTSFGWPVRRLTIDTDVNCLEIEMADGAIHREQAVWTLRHPKSSPPREFRRITYDTVEQTLTMIAPSGEALVLEVFNGSDPFDQRGGRTVIYLDQNKWILLGRTIHSPEKVPASEAAAATALIQLARDQRVILPLSSGHLIETSRADRIWRQQLGPLMVSLSRGWLMRDPLLVRRSELFSLFRARAAGPADPVGDVFTLDPMQLFAEGFEVSPLGADLPEGLRLLAGTLSTITAVFAVLIENEVVHSALGYERAGAWAASHFDLAQELRSNGSMRELSREVTRVRFLDDLGLDLAHAVAAGGLRVEGFQAWLSELAEDDIAQLPYLGRMRDVIHFRLCNADDNWEPNDLVDMLYLPCAAAYADFVVAEKKTAHYLERAERRRSGGARVVTTLADLLDRLAPDFNR